MTLNQISSGSNNTVIANTLVYGAGLIVSGSQSATTTGGSTFVGRFNATGSLQESTNETVFVVGTGTGAGTAAGGAFFFPARFVGIGCGATVSTPV